MESKEIEVKLKVIHEQKITQYFYSGNCPNCGEIITDNDTVKLDYKGFCPECRIPIRITSE